MLECLDKTSFTQDVVACPASYAGPGVMVMRKIPGIYSGAALFAERDLDAPLEHVLVLFAERLRG